MSVAFWPKLGMVTWGSEAAATKVGLGRGDRDDDDRAAPGLMDGFRFDLDDVQA